MRQWQPVGSPAFLHENKLTHCPQVENAGIEIAAENRALPCAVSEGTSPDEMMRNMRREAQAHALTQAVIGCDRDDRIPFLEAILDGLRAGMPIALFGKIMDEANFWAEQASRAERKAYCAACFACLDREDQDAFRSFIAERRAA